MESSGNTTTSAPRPAASRAARAMRSTFPERSPTVGLICASATRMGLFIVTARQPAPAESTKRTQRVALRGTITDESEFLRPAVSVIYTRPGGPIAGLGCILKPGRFARALQCIANRKHFLIEE